MPASSKQTEQGLGRVQGKVPEVGNEGGMEGEITELLKGQDLAEKIMGENRELMEEQERGERQSKGKTVIEGT